MPRPAFGLDVDGSCTNSGTCEGVKTMSCRSRSMELPYDGANCRDNAFANWVAVASMIPQIAETCGLSEESLNCGLARGSYNMLIRLRGYDDSLHDPEVRVDWYTSPGLEKQPSGKCVETDFRQAPPWRYSAL